MSLPKPSLTRSVALLGVTLAAVLVFGPPVALGDDLKDGRTALQAGRLDDAVRSFEKAAAQGSAAGRAGVGQVWLRRRQLDKAMEAFQIAQRMDPQLAQAYSGQGEVFRRQEKCDQAVPLFTKATELDRKFPDAQLGLGDCYLTLKQFDKAVAAFSEGLKWGPKQRPRFLVALGAAETERDSLRAAGIYFTRAREEAPNDPEVRKALGDFYFRRGTWALAVIENQAAVAIDTNDVELRFALAQSLDFADRPSDALEEYQRVAAKDPDFAPAQLGLGTLLYRAGNQGKTVDRHQEAMTPLKRYTEMEPTDGKGWSVLGRNLYYLKMPEEAFAAMQKAEQLGGANKEMYTILGRYYADKKEWGKALDAFAKGEPSARDQLVIAQVMVFQFNPQTADSIYMGKADSVYRAIVAKDSTAGEARFALVEMGKLRFRKKDYPEAIALFERRIQLDPNSGEAYYYIGLSRKEMKQNLEALTALQRAAELDSTKGDRFFWLGVVYDVQKQPDEARQAFERSVQFDSTSNLAGKAYRQLGFYRLLSKDWTGAVRLLERAVQLDSRDVQAWVWLGQGYQNAGNRNKAMEAYRKALELDPNQADAQKGVQVLSGAAQSRGASQ
ncbi:MAG TPA: tetratricopeptide repeat protein [Candidatus Limnocylindria bacterium]|nr:tetratricopeptide repeat protein [Candidatus Limnocylindria bacterium]